MKQKHEIGIVIASVLIIAAAVYRILPHPYNFAPVTGIALLSGAYIRNKRWAFVIPVLALYISDLIINNGIFRNSFPGEGGLVLFSPYMIFVYSSFLFITAAGIKFLKKVSVLKLTGMALGSSLLFFLVTNFGVWIWGTMYPKTLGGLGACYLAALPFFQSTLLGDLFFTGVLFGAFELSRRAYFRWFPVSSS